MASPLEIIQQGNALAAPPNGYRWSYMANGQAVLVPVGGLSDRNPDSMSPGIGFTSDKPAYLPNMLMSPAPQQGGTYKTPPSSDPDPRYIDPRFIFWGNNPSTKSGYNWRT